MQQRARRSAQPLDGMSVTAASAFGRTLLLVIALAFVSCDLQDDPIEQAGRETKRLLGDYGPGRDPKPVQAWLSRSHGEAPGSEVMNVFVAWALKNRRSAEAIMENFPSAQEGGLARRVTWAAVDSGIEDQFIAVFGSTSSGFFRLAIEECREFDDCATAMSSNTSLEREGEDKVPSPAPSQRRCAALLNS